MVTQSQIQSAGRVLVAVSGGEFARGVAALTLALFEGGGGELLRTGDEVESAAVALLAVGVGEQFDAGVLAMSRALGVRLSVQQTPANSSVLHQSTLLSTGWTNCQS